MKWQYESYAAKLLCGMFNFCKTLFHTKWNFYFNIHSDCSMNTQQCTHWFQMKFNDTNGVYDSAMNAGILLMKPIENETVSDEPYQGVLSGEVVVFPDYSIPETIEWFLNQTWPFSGLVNSFILKDNWPENHKNESNCTVDLPYIRKVSHLKLCFFLIFNLYVNILLLIQNHKIRYIILLYGT